MLYSTMAVAAGGALGAVSRLASASLIQKLLGDHFPSGTLFVNCIGSFLIGLVMSVLLGRFAFGAEYWRMFLVVGFLGAYTTFSSFAWDTWLLYNSGHMISALINVLSNTLGSLVLVMFGLKAGRMIGGA